MMKRACISTGTLAVFAVAMVATAAPPPFSSDVPPPPEPLIIAGLSASIDAPSKVLAGSSFKGMVTVTMEDLGVAVVEITPLDEDEDQCGIGSHDITGGFDLGNNRYMIANIPGLFSPDLAELQMKTVPSFVRMSVGYNTEDVIDGQCNVKASVLQPLNPLESILPLSTMVELQLPAVPMGMGLIETAGGWDVEDGADVVLPATPLMVYTVVSDDPQVILQGSANHADGNDWGDYGKFWFSGSDAEGLMSLAEPTLEQPYSVVASVPYTHDDTVDTEFCFEAVYVDSAGSYWGGYWWETERGHVKTCGILRAVAPDVMAVADEVCRLFWSAAAQLQFAAGPVAYLAPTAGQFAGSVLNIAYAQWAQTCEPFSPNHGSPSNGA